MLRKCYKIFIILKYVREFQEKSGAGFQCVFQQRTICVKIGHNHGHFPDRMEGVSALCGDGQAAQGTARQHGE